MSVRPRPARGRPMAVVACLTTILLLACSGPAGTASPGSPTGKVRLYASVPQDTVDAVLAAFAAAEPDIAVELFRAPTGELAARIAAERRDAGRVLGDVLWLTDPLSIQAYAAEGLLKQWSPEGAATLDPTFVGEGFWGTRVLNVVVVRGADVTPGPASWRDLADPAYRDAVALPDPGFAGSAFGALGYFALDPAFGLDFYRSLKANGAVQVKSPDEVTAGVAEGRFKAGMTLDFSARQAIAKGSPVAMVWPSPGAIALYGPIAVVGATENGAAAESLVEFVLSADGQRALAETGWQPVRPEAGGPKPEGAQVWPDWPTAFGRQAELLEEYRQIFGG